MHGFQDAFISYGRIDSKAFVIRLHERLQNAGFDVWFDQMDIPLGVNFQNQIDSGIEQADNFLFIISPHSVNSPYCLKEIQLAVRYNKRIIPLLHVEHVSRETWQERNPNGTDEEWERYQEKGLHTCFPNMHPDIAKINWVYFREGMDDFERSLDGLIETLNRHRDYVHQHTCLLIKALEWEQHQKQTQYLLVEEERMEAEFWLSQRFHGEQAPCEPTDLHCEFICESIKNANNLMTQAFICHAPEARNVAEAVGKVLMREQFTVWTSALSVKRGVDPWDEIKQGIERADRILCILSPGFGDSEDCMKEVAYALELNKPIIPLRLRATVIFSKRKRGMTEIYHRLGVVDENPILDRLKAMPSIHFALPEMNPDEHQLSVDQLLREMNKESAYYEQHKMLLVRALRWQANNRLPGLLLRGHNLQQAKAWLETSKTSGLQPPTPLQEELIATSLAQPPQVSTAAFVGYSPVDSDFARKLNNALQDRGKSTWFDQDNLTLGADTKREREYGIETADNVVMVLSPNAVRSPRCQEELAYARSLNKRIVPIIYEAVVPEELPDTLATLQAIDFTEKKNFLDNLGALIASLETDQDYRRMHTRLQIRAMEWDAGGRDNGSLLRGKELKGATQWLQEAATKSPPATDLQKTFIEASQALPSRRVKGRTVTLTSVAATALVAIARFMGLLQGAELVAYDSLLRSRSNEAQDNRFLIVQVDEPSLRFLNANYPPGRGTIPDEALLDVLNALKPHQPRLIGLDFYRDFPAKPELAGPLRDTRNLITVCKTSYPGWGQNVDNAIPHAPEVSPEQIGFSDMLDDARGERYVRRHYLMQQAEEGAVCQPKESFSLVLAQRYLASEGVSLTSPEDPSGTYYVQDLRVGDRAIPQLRGNGGAYQEIDGQLRGYQTLLNYRKYEGDPRAFAPQVSLQSLLQGEVPAELMRDRIVMVGFTALSSTAADLWNTPYGEIPGVVLQSQKASQLISAALDDRPLFWWLPLGLETLWILGWSILGGVVVWGFRKAGLPVAVGGLVVLWGLCYGVFIYGGGWLPLVPAAIAVLISAGVVGYLTYRLRKV